jgi:putative transposase
MSRSPTGHIAYVWRQLTPEQRAALMAWRKQRSLPWHRPPHRPGDHTRYHVTAACFEHRPYVGRNVERMNSFCGTLLGALASGGAQAHAWCVLPNHYHALVETHDVLGVLAELGRMHGRLSFTWNGEENTRGRQVWCGITERYMRGDAHFWATLNYVHHNPVHHRYVDHWQDWPFSSAREYLDQMGRGFAEQTWRGYPLLDYGKGWDDASL